MDSYIVRIYRRGGRRSCILVGTIEEAGSRRKMAFSNVEELWEILGRRKGGDSWAPQSSRRRYRKEVMSATATSATEASVEGVCQIKSDFVP